MKYILFTTIMILGTNLLFSQSNKIQWGVSLATTNSISKFSAGSSNAHARFHQNNYNGGEWQLSARKNINEHIFVQTGLGITELGFSSAITNNYSLLNNNGHYTFIKHKWTEGSIPVLGYYKSNLNCRNWRYVGGLGFSLAWNGKIESYSNVSAYSTENSYLKAPEALTQTSNVQRYFTVKGLISVGMEKQFKRNQIFGVYIFGSLGSRSVANSFVEYTLDNQTYKHQFTNNGSYWGLKFSYFFRIKTQ